MDLVSAPAPVPPPAQAEESSEHVTGIPLDSLWNRNREFFSLGITKIIGNTKDLWHGVLRSIGCGWEAEK